ncbi:MAG: acetyl-CoA carboxylase biotin carboxyl carrier protein [Oscillospiraceae bacterium]|nr:acetyl-CoA carboxylase biotin carboxyl carrier protein [Oscillospiraceae bacterium]
MDIITITKELSGILKEKDLGSIFVRNGDMEIHVTGKTTQYQFAGGVPVASAANSAPTAAPATATQAAEGNYITSPTVGTFYAASAPDEQPFVKVGDRVTKGQVVCIVEAMKLMNEIPCEFDGTVAEILVNDGDLVDYGKELMRVV